MDYYEKTFYILILFLLILVLIISMFYKSNPTISKTNYKSLNKNSQISDKLNLQKKTLIVYFSTDCGNCSMILNEILNSNKLKNELNILLIAAEKDKNKVKSFLKHNKLEKLNTLVYLDTENNFIKDFGLGFRIVVSYPQILYFNEKKEFIKKITELSEINKI